VTAQEDQYTPVAEAHQLTVSDDPYYRGNIVCSCGILPGNPTAHILAQICPSASQQPVTQVPDRRESSIEWRTAHGGLSAVEIEGMSKDG
jgi:hypothetical protein